MLRMLLMQLLCLAPRTVHCMSRSLVSNSSMCCLFSFCSVSLVLMLSRLEVSQFSPRILQFTFQLTDCETCVPPAQQGNKKLKTSKIRVAFLHASSAQLFRPSSKLSRTGFDLKTECREMDRTRFRLCLRKTVGRHLVRFHLGKFHFWSWRSILQEKRHQLNMSRLASGSLSLDHAHSCRGITTLDLLPC